MSREFSDGRHRAGFTLVEMLVVIGMLGILMAAAFTGLGQARNQARVTKANAEVRQLIGAWLAYEAAYDDWPADLKGGVVPATQTNLKELLGEGQNKTVFLNVQMSGDAFRDPWGHPYLLKVTERSVKDVEDVFSAAVTFPNRSRDVYVPVSSSAPGGGTK